MDRPATDDKYFYVSGQLSLMGVTFLFNLVAAKLIGPEQMGVWQTISLISVYGMIITFGAINGMGRDVPYYRGKGDDKEVKRTISTTIFYLLALMVVFLAMISLGYELLPDAARMVMVLGVVLLCARIANAFSVILIRSFRDFRRLGMHQGMTALIMLLTIGPLILFRNLYTVYWGVFLSLIVAVLLSGKYCVTQPRSKKVLRRLLSIGFPIYIVGLVFILLTSVDRVIVLGFLGTEQLGIYTLASTAMAVLMMAPTLVSNVMYPRLAEHYGATEAISDLVPMVKNIIRLNLLLVIPIAALFLVTFYFYVVPTYLDAYMSGRDAMAIIIISAVFLPVGVGFGDVFNVVGMQKIYLRNAIIGLVVNICVGLLLVGQLGAGLEGAAIGTVAGLLAFMLLQVGSFLSLSVAEATE